MSTRNFVFSSAILLPLFSAAPAQAQRVNADIIIGGGPVSGRITIGDRGRYERRPRAIRRIEWVRVRHDNRRDDRYRKFRNDHRVVIVYYDRRDDRYYLDRFHPGLVEIRVYERGGNYYRLEDDRDYGRYAERYDDRGYDDRRSDDRRRDDRRGERRDDRRGDRDYDRDEH